MKRTLALSALTSIPFLALGTSLIAQQRSDFVSEASFVVGTYQPAKANHSPTEMAERANAFLKTLDASQVKQVRGPLDGEIRRAWTNLPARPDADGIRMGLLNSQQAKAACDLMASLFSKQGYDKMVHIMLADDQLLRGGRPGRGFGTEDFSLVIFGNPSEKKPWAFQLDGHHVGVNLSIEGEKVTMSPSFIGTQPEAFKIGKKTYRPFAGEMDLAYKLAGSLTFEQLKTAIISDRRGPIRTGPGRDGRIPRKAGVSCSTFSESQKKDILKLISQWVNDLPEKQARVRMATIEKELDQTSFAWSGDKAPRSDVSYIIQGPSLIIEYACQDLGGNPLNHLHSVYRDPTNEYGGQLK